ncbi:hypothetical protein QYE76_025849 [Lolium multiflorum]|uniref:CCHC-type domain-containing protein n=1 Tax=Lolium multiflorum TaxID=4521 RepID=A0AAD8RG75_LOLMU|nr:hypothetical protein QYE76_025849 [Lolium multiflorum]
MASSSAFPAIAVLGHPPTDKLTRQNHPMWRAQVLPAIRGAQLLGLLDGSDAAPPEMMTVEATAQDADKSAKSVPNPAYATWLARDQMVLSYLLGSISPGVMPHIMRLEHAAGVWKVLETMFASQSQSKITNLRIAMATTRRLNDSVDVYLLKMQTIADELAAAGKPVPEEEQVAYIMAGLGSEYANLVESYGILKAPPTLGELYAQLQAHDERKTLNYGSSAGVFETSANAASRQSYSRGYTSGGRGAPRDDRRDRRPNRRDDRPDGRRDQRDDRPPRHGRGGGRAPPGGGRGRGRGRKRTTPWVDVTCQICGREGHPAKDCWYRFTDDDTESYEEKEAHVASYGVDTNWYSDTGATHHITGELNNLTMRDSYHGNDRVNTANGQVFPFQALHPNAGALLKQEILLLDPSLHNSEHGDATLDDTNLANAPNPSLGMSSPSDVQGSTRRAAPADENLRQNGAQTTSETSHEISAQEDTDTGHGADSPTESISGSGGSSSDHASTPTSPGAAGSARGARSPSPAASHGSFAPSAAATPSSVSQQDTPSPTRSTAAPGDDSISGLSVRADSDGSSASGSSVPSPPAARPAAALAPPGARPTTRARHDFHGSGRYTQDRIQSTRAVGLFEYVVMTFGLNAGATYQRAMNYIFHDLIGKLVEVYIDDVVVKSVSMEGHLDDLRRVLDRTRKFGLRMNPKKCAFGVTAGQFLGFLVHERGIEIGLKSRRRCTMQPPTTKKELQRLIGKINFVRRFISNLSGRIEPFMALVKTKSDDEFHWGQNSNGRLMKLSDI